MPRFHPEILKRARRLRKAQTPSEVSLWSRLRDRRLNDLKFYRQHPIGPYIVDFYHPDTRLVIEVDGGVHLDQEEYDQSRTDWLTDHGYRVVRFTNDEVHFQLNAVLSEISKACIEG